MLLDYRSGAVILSNETTTHDSQMTADANARRHPTLYYSESSGVGRVIEETQRKSPAIRIGVVGLGAGTLAAYARPEDTIDFWDIDPKAIRVARDFFTYVPDCRGQVHIQQRDGRKGLEASTEDYDVIVIDAFCGDAIPAHLLTREALAIYFRRLEKRQGILVVHSSNRYSTLFPVVGATAYTMLRWSTISVLTEISSTTPTRDWDADGRGSQYLILCRPGQLKEVTSWLPEQEDNGRVKRNVATYDPQPPGRAVIWTDDRQAALDTLDLKRYLTGR
jgi:predicted O-methyltransferase YrrM